MLESHIFVKQKRDGKIKARKVIGGNKKHDYITEEDVSSPTVSADAVMLTCVIDACEERDVAVFKRIPLDCGQQGRPRAPSHCLHLGTIGGRIGVNCTRCIWTVCLNKQELSKSIDREMT